jgi:hypothetical protein
MNPSTGRPETRWTQTEQLAAPLQQSLTSQMNIGAGRAALAEGSMARAWEDYSNPMDFDQFGGPIAFDYDPTQQRQAAEDSAYQKQANRLDPQFATQEQALRSRLMNQGLSAGDQAYDAAMNNFNTGRNDAYEQARLGSTAEGRNESNLMFGQASQQNQIANLLRQQGIQEELGKRGFNLSEVERLLQGQLIQGGPPSSGGQTATGQQGSESTSSTKLLGGG